jgi:single-strand DNA-binding protein
MQTLIIAGTIGRDAEVRQTQGGESVAGFSVAVDNGKDQNGNKRETTWFDCSLWGKRGQGLGPHLTKGTRVAITGRPSAREHNGKIYMQCSVDQIQLLGGGNQQAPSDPYAPQGGTTGHQQPVGGGNNLDDGIPF